MAAKAAFIHITKAKGIGERSLINKIRNGRMFFQIECVHLNYEIKVYN